MGYIEAGMGGKGPQTVFLSYVSLHHRCARLCHHIIIMTVIGRTDKHHDVPRRGWRSRSPSLFPKRHTIPRLHAIVRRGETGATHIIFFSPSQVVRRIARKAWGRLYRETEEKGMYIVVVV